jgi:hypothetical protein
MYIGGTGAECLFIRKSAISGTAQVYNVLSGFGEQKSVNFFFFE